MGKGEESKVLKQEDSDDEIDECPLCMDPLELDDKNFYPCTCGYQICRFCWHRIRTDENGLCPACRKPYSETPAEYIPITQAELDSLRQAKRNKKAEKRAKNLESRKALANVRVIQKNLVYVIGLPMKLAEESLLKKPEYFGQYGKVMKVVINKNNPHSTGSSPTFGAYITFSKKEDAAECVRGIDKSIFEGRLLRASLGTTKYCTYFLRSINCPNPECMYLHELGDEAASFYSKEEAQHARYSIPGETPATNNAPHINTNLGFGRKPLTAPPKSANSTSSPKFPSGDPSKLPATSSSSNPGVGTPTTSVTTPVFPTPTNPTLNESALPVGASWGKLKETPSTSTPPPLPSTTSVPLSSPSLPPKDSLLTESANSNPNFPNDDDVDYNDAFTPATTSVPNTMKNTSNGVSPPRPVPSDSWSSSLPNDPILSSINGSRFLQYVTPSSGSGDDYTLNGTPAKPTTDPNLSSNLNDLFSRFDFASKAKPEGEGPSQLASWGGLSANTNGSSMTDPWNATRVAQQSTQPSPLLASNNGSWSFPFGTSTVAPTQPQPHSFQASYPLPFSQPSSQFQSSFLQQMLAPSTTQTKPSDQSQPQISDSRFASSFTQQQPQNSSSSGNGFPNPAMPQMGSLFAQISKQPTPTSPLLSVGNNPQDLFSNSQLSDQQLQQKQQQQQQQQYYQMQQQYYLQLRYLQQQYASQPMPPTQSLQPQTSQQYQMSQQQHSQEQNTSIFQQNEQMQALFPSLNLGANSQRANPSANGWGVPQESTPLPSSDLLNDPIILMASNRNESRLSRWTSSPADAQPVQQLPPLPDMSVLSKTAPPGFGGLSVPNSSDNNNGTTGSHFAPFFSPSRPSAPPGFS